MEHDRWSWFAGGVVLGLLIGAGVTGGCFIPKLTEARRAEARAEADAAQAKAENARRLQRLLARWDWDVDGDMDGPGCLDLLEDYLLDKMLKRKR